MVPPTRLSKIVSWKDLWISEVKNNFTWYIDQWSQTKILNPSHKNDHKTFFKNGYKGCLYIGVRVVWGVVQHKKETVWGGKVEDTMGHGQTCEPLKQQYWQDWEAFILEFKANSSWVWCVLYLLWEAEVVVMWVDKQGSS